MYVCFTPKKQTSPTAIMTSALCEKRTHAVQQAAGYEMILSALASSDSGTCITQLCTAFAASRITPMTKLGLGSSNA
jgi:hypothetical protein